MGPLRTGSSRTPLPLIALSAHALSTMMAAQRGVGLAVARRAQQTLLRAPFAALAPTSAASVSERLQELREAMVRAQLSLLLLPPPLAPAGKGAGQC